MLSVENVHSGYPLHPVIRGVSLEVADGEIMALVGPNGAGKTTLLRTVVGLIPVARGRVILRGEDITGWRADRIVHRGLAYVPEGISIFPRMTVEQNLILSLARDESGVSESLGSAFSLFPSLGSHRRHPAEHLSGGEKRMLTIARGIVLKPRLLLLDDPFLGLAPHLVIRLCDFFRDMNRGGVTILIAGQHVRRILRMASRACLLEEGQVTLTGSGANFLKSHHLHERLIGLKSGGYF